MNIDNKQINEISKFLSYVLRHEPQSIGIQLDTEGWADIESLIAGAARQGRTLDRSIIRSVVSTSDKKRFAISEDGACIRAVQGHSTPTVQREYAETEPPEILYHGTATRFLESIREQGLKAGARHHVHLSQDVSTAAAVGRRYGSPVIIEIHALRMYQEGFTFFLAENGVWLTESVPTGFFSVPEGVNF